LRLGGEPALMPVFVNGGNHVEVRSTAEHMAIFIRRSGNVSGEPHETRSRRRAPVQVVSGDRNARGRNPVERDAVRHDFVVTTEVGEKS
jgi:hypothetical protein